MTVTLRWITPAADPELYAGERRLRYEVLRRPLGMPEGSEENAAEARCEHCVAIAFGTAAKGDAEVGRVVGCVLWLADSDARGGKLLQMAVAEDQRGRDVGRRLVRELERQVGQRGVGVVRMHARETAVGFYLKLGYAVVGDPFSEVGLPHRLMQRAI